MESKLEEMNLDDIEIEELEATKKPNNISFSLSSLVKTLILGIFFSGFLFFFLDSIDIYLYITCVELLITIFFAFVYHWTEKKKLQHIILFFLVFTGFSSLFCLILYLFFL